MIYLYLMYVQITENGQKLTLYNYIYLFFYSPLVLCCIVIDPSTGELGTVTKCWSDLSVQVTTPPSSPESSAGSSGNCRPCFILAPVLVVLRAQHGSTPTPTVTVICIMYISALLLVVCGVQHVSPTSKWSD